MGTMEIARRLEILQRKDSKIKKQKKLSLNENKTSSPEGFDEQLKKRGLGVDIHP